MPSQILLPEISISNQDQKKKIKKSRAGLSPNFLKEQFQQSIKPEQASPQVLSEMITEGKVRQRNFKLMSLAFALVLLNLP